MDIFVKPGPGRLVRDPVTKQAKPADGFYVSDADVYWLRRLRDGDVVKANPPASSASAASGKQGVTASSAEPEGAAR